MAADRQAPVTKPPAEQPVEARLQNYVNLRQTLASEIGRQAALLAKPFISIENLPDLLETASQTVSQRSIKFLPKKTALTREDIQGALTTAFEELARKQDWLDETLPRKRREELVAGVAATIAAEIPQASLQDALAQREEYRKAAQATLEDQEVVSAAVQADLEQKIDKQTAGKVAQEVTENLDRKALHLGASPTPAVAAAVDLAIERHAPDLSPEEHAAVASTVLQGEGGKKLQSRYGAVGEASDDIKAIFDKHKTFSRVVRKEVEKDVVLSIADESQDRKPSVVHLKAPLRLGKNHDIEVRKLELHNRTREADPNLPQNSAMPLFRYGARIAKPKTATLDAVESFTVFDPETHKRITITKDKLDLKALQKIDRRAFEKLSFLFDEKNLKGFENTYRWLKNPVGEALRSVTRPVTTRVRSGVSALTKPLRDLVGKATAPLRGAVQRTTTAVKTAVGKVTTPVRQAVGKAVGFVTSPIKKAAGKLAMKGVQLGAKLLIKIGLGGVVKKIEQLALAGSVVGIPVLIAQELVTRGLGKLGMTAKKLLRDWKQVFQEGLQDPIRGSIRFIGTGVDTLGAGIGGVAGGGIGAAGGALLGAAIGSILPGIGTLIGGIVGGVGGGIFGAGYGAKKGYEFRRKLQKKILIFLALKSLGLNPFKIALALLKTSAIWAIGKVAPLIQAVFSRAVLGAKSLVGIARYGPNFLVQQLGTGQGIVSQTLRNLGNLFSRIPSGIARAFNTITGWASGSVVNATSTIDAVSTEILTAGPSESLPIVSVIGTLAAILLFSFITYTALITIFHSTPTEVIPYVEASNTGSRFIGITKEACVGTTCSEDILSLANASSGGPYSIQYTISVEALDGTLSNVQITDTYAAYGENNPPTPPPESWDGGITIPDGSAWEQTITLTIPRSSEWDDAALTNVVSVTAVVVGEVEPVQNSESVLICFGDCPVCPPTLSPLDSPVISGYHFGSAPTNSCLNPPVEHRGIDINSSSSTVYSSFACPAVVEFVDDATFGLGTYMVLRSGPWYAFYAHLVEGSYAWQAGDVITGRQPIGIKDCTGNCDGTHLHYEIRDSTLGGVNPADHCEPAVSVNPCGFGDWGVGGAETCAL
ncbi:MAG: hypothetical protein A2785_03685 [Candidatus Chisholmbacteria bacterium RIFCSPHIGHO2_01_FULL_49_18]|uniref:M23ase beta-sheet core domain-containing protein n=2 Tax=Candidatus Chisholmiibacteriota TaxID=1817900 RepID=A0A1G1VN64_9BACT|nr:MAG: hypothetical protein A2785_03685 [Candidatus Chisholmbacteria bacterium RIFCSPHIGHO2_01_FULL_49_18]OGY19467.1 MAG: hypothetical protein A3A65_06175 [Candidatus Chisholmbacteria bacterium RIFCSPLOWO2_01_FULL_49_14]